MTFICENDYSTFPLDAGNGSSSSTRPSALDHSLADRELNMLVCIQMITYIARSNRVAPIIHCSLKFLKLLTNATLQSSYNLFPGTNMRLTIKPAHSAPLTIEIALPCHVCSMKNLPSLGFRGTVTCAGNAIDGCVGKHGENQ